MMNHMEEVAKILNVEMDEEFKISGRKDIWKINEKGLVSKSKKGEWEPYNAILMLLLIGEEEIQKPILDETEQKYLLQIIRPFRDKVQYIAKIRYCTSEEIFIGYKGSPDDVSISNIVLPYFDSGTMYKGMKAGVDYSLEDLGL